MSKESMKLALEALEKSTDNFPANVQHRKAITALREALAEQPAQQEPVAWMFQHGETGRTLCVDAQQVKWGFEERNPSYQKIAPLYTSPPARHGWTTEQIAGMARLKEAQDKKLSQRTWQGLTDEERDDLLDTYITAEGRARAIEAKLKEKNT